MEKVKKLSVGTVFEKFYEFEDVSVEYESCFGGVYNRSGIRVRKQILIGDNGEELVPPREESTFIAHEAMLFLQIIR